MKIGESKHKGGKSFSVLEEGTYPAILVQVIDLGVQPQEDWKTKKPKPPAHKVLFTFELPTETVEIDGEDKPRWMSKDYTYSFNEKAALSKVVQVLMKDKPKAKALDDLLGAACMLNVGHTASGNAKIAGIVPKIKGMTLPESTNNLIAFDLDNPDLNTFNNLHEWIQNKITSSINFNQTKLAKVLGDKNDDEDMEYEDDDNHNDELEFDDD